MQNFHLIRSDPHPHRTLARRWVAWTRCQSPHGVDSPTDVGNELSLWYAMAHGDASWIATVQLWHTETHHGLRLSSIVSPPSLSGKTSYPPNMYLKVPFGASRLRRQHQRKPGSPAECPALHGYLVALAGPFVAMCAPIVACTSREKVIRLLNPDGTSASSAEQVLRASSNQIQYFGRRFIISRSYFPSAPVPIRPCFTV